MATVIGKTSVKIDELLANVFVGAEIQPSGHLLFTTRAGGIIDAGTIAPPEPGYSTEPEDVVVVFTTPSTLWTVEHNMDQPMVNFVCFDLAGDEIVGDPHYVNDNVLTIEWFYPTAGQVRVSH